MRFMSVPRRSTHELTNNSFNAANVFICIHNGIDIVTLTSELVISVVLLAVCAI
jgi:hypothetical protein